jgi:hypothetical protein
MILLLTEWAEGVENESISSDPPEDDAAGCEDLLTTISAQGDDEEEEPPSLSISHTLKFTMNVQLTLILFLGLFWLCTQVQCDMGQNMIPSS